MATRTICFPISGYPYCKEQPVTFTWIKGSKRQNIRAVHDAVHTTDPDVSILEVSSASAQPEGEAVSSLRLLLRLNSVAQDVPISTVFEAAKVFEHGGPFADLLTCAPSKVHKDTRLRTNGKLLRYSLEGSEYPIEPHPDSFFEWLYCRALKQFPEKAAQLSRYNAFSDIAAAADSKKYYGDSSRAAAIYVGLAAAGKLPCIDSYESFIAESPCPSLESLRLLQKRHPRFLHQQRRSRQTNRRSPIMQIFRTLRRWNRSLSCPKRPVCSSLWQKMPVFLQIIPVSWRIRERNFFLPLIRKH